MRYQIRQKIFSFADSYVVKDEFDNERFVVRGQVFSLGHKLRIENLEGNELVYIEQKLFKFLPAYEIYMGGNFAASVKKEFTFFKPRFIIESSMGDYSIEGDYFAHEFDILKNGMVVASVSKEWFAFSDTYGVDISDTENQAFMLALVIVIDTVLHDNDK